MIREKQNIFNRIQIIADCFCTIFSMAISLLLLRKYSFLETLNLSYLELFGIAVGISLFHIVFYRLFQIYHSYRATRFLMIVLNIIKANLTSYAILIMIAYLWSHLLTFQLFFFLSFFINTFFLICYRYLLRKILRYFRSKGYNKKYLLLLGVNNCTNDFIDKIKLTPDLGYELLGYFNDKAVSSVSIPYLGKATKLNTYLSKTIVDEAIIMLKDGQEQKTTQMIEICEKWGIKFSIIPNVFSIFKSRIFVSSFDGMPVLNLRKIPLDSLPALFIKRIFDIVLSIICLILFSPIMLTAAIAVKVTSPGPVLYKQIRVGLNRKPFQIYKFRSMTVESGSIIKMAVKNDARCTPVGNFMRKCSIDELPQLWNVLKGDMSLVGPRPEIPHFVEKFKEYIPSYMLKHYVKPGITGWAQVNGLRGNTSIPDRIQYDMYYIEHWSLFFDIKILFLTIFKGIINKNAY